LGPGVKATKLILFFIASLVGIYSIQVQGRLDNEKPANLLCSKFCMAVKTFKSILLTNKLMFVQVGNLVYSNNNLSVRLED